MSPSNQFTFQMTGYPQKCKFDKLQNVSFFFGISSLLTKPEWSSSFKQSFKHKILFLNSSLQKFKGSMPLYKIYN